MKSIRNFDRQSEKQSSQGTSLVAFAELQPPVRALDHEKHLLFALLTYAAVAAHGQVIQAAVSEALTNTNLSPGEQIATRRRASPLAGPAKRFLPEKGGINSFETGTPVELLSTLTRAIIPTIAGAEALERIFRQELQSQLGKVSSARSTVTML